MPYYNTCPNCGSSLDPGESCDCQKEREETDGGKQMRVMRETIERPEERQAGVRPYMLG